MRRALLGAALLSLVSTLSVLGLGCEGPLPPDPERVLSLALLEGPGPLSVAGPLPAIRVELRDADGVPVELDGELLIEGTGEASLGADSVLRAPLVAGRADFDMLEAEGPGELRLTVSVAEDFSEEVAPLALEPILIGLGERSRPHFLEGARVGVPYADALPGSASPYVGGEPPEGLALDGATGVVMGTPTRAGHGRFEVAALAADGWLERLVVELPVFDEEEPAPALDPTEPGPYEVAAMILTIPSITTSRGDFPGVALRVAYPAAGAGVAEGRFPLIAFHHAAHSPPDIYASYTALHDHWASHGFLVASVDSQVNVTRQSQSWSNLSDMSLFQRAAIEHLRALSEDEGSIFFGRLDPDRILVSGHSRGGGASLISLWEDPRLFGAICFEQVSPIQTPGQDFGDPERNADRPLPERPVLIFVASNDRDEPWPLVDLSYDQATGPRALVTLHGTNHEDTYDPDTPGTRTSTSAISVAERHALDQRYSTAFLHRFFGGDLSFDRAIFGREALSSELSPLGVSVSADRFMNTALPVEGFQEDPAENLLGGANLGEGLTRDEDAFPYGEGLSAVGRNDARGEAAARWSSARRLTWSGPGASFTLETGGGLDVRRQRSLLLRAARYCPPPPSSLSTPDTTCPHVDLRFQVALRDADGEAVVEASDSMGALGVRGRHFSDAIVPLEAFDGVDLSALTAIELRFSSPGITSGDVWIDDVRFE